MNIYFNGMELIALCVVIICGLFLLFAKWADKYYNTHENWLTHLLAKIFGI